MMMLTSETAIWIVLSLVAGLALSVIVWALTLDLSGVVRALNYRQKALMQQGIQVRLDQAQLAVSAGEFVRRSMLHGACIAAGLYFVVGALVLVPLGFAAGVLITWTQLEIKRDKMMVEYNQQLANACDTLRNAYLTTGSLSNALKSVMTYGAPLVRDDFALALTAARQGEFAQGLQSVANKRRSIVFDAVANALLRAEESSGAVSEMLERLSESTRQNVAAFESAMIMQINARSNVNWGAFGPWAVFAVFRVMTTTFGEAGVTAVPEYFTTLQGNLVAGAAGLLTIVLHRWCYRLAQRDLTVQRIETSDPGAFRSGTPATPMPGFAVGELQPAIAARMRQRPIGENAGLGGGPHV
jgi:Flp pilus assembly protein TadB